MRLITTIQIPEEASVADVGVQEFLTGLGVCKTFLAEMKVIAEFEPLDQPSMDISSAIVNHTVQEIQLALGAHMHEAKTSTNERVKQAVSAGIGLLDRWDEILTELSSRGWDRPKWEIRA
jgi:hypothetical protein